MDRKLSFSEHLEIATVKAINVEQSWRLMPNIGGSRGAKKRLVVNMVHSKLLYAALVSANSLQNDAIQRKLLLILLITNSVSHF